MRVLRSEPGNAKGWMDGPWMSGLPIALGYASAALDEPLVHATVTEIFLVGRGEATARVDHGSVDLAPGDVLVVEPGEARAIVHATADLLMFVVHVAGDDGSLGDDKMLVQRERLGL